MEVDQWRYHGEPSQKPIPRVPRPTMEFRRSVIPGPSSTRSGSTERDSRSQLHHSDTLPMSHSFKEPIQPADFGSGKHSISRSFRTATTTEDGQKIIEEERLTRLTDDTIFTLSNMHPRRSLSIDKDRNLILEESSTKVDFCSQRPTRDGARSSSRWRQSRDHSRIWSVPWSSEMPSEEPQRNDEERRQDNDQDEDEWWAIEFYFVYCQLSFRLDGQTCPSCLSRPQSPPLMWMMLGTSFKWWEGC